MSDPEIAIRWASGPDDVCGAFAAGFAVESEPFEEAGIPHVWMGQRI